MWAEELDAAGVPNAAVQTIAQVAAHPQTQALGMLRGEPGTERMFFGLPLSFDNRRPDRDDECAGAWSGQRGRSGTGRGLPAKASK